MYWLRSSACPPGLLPGVTPRDVIQPFPLLGVFAAGLKALHNAIMAERRAVAAGADDLRRRPALVPGV